MARQPRMGLRLLQESPPLPSVLCQVAPIASPGRIGIPCYIVQPAKLRSAGRSSAPGGVI